MVRRPERNKFRQSDAGIKGQGTTYLYPANTWEVGHRSRLSEGVVWRWEKKGSILGFPLKFLWGAMFCWDVISPKRGKYGLRLLDACYRGRWWENLIFIWMSEVKTKRGKKQNKQFCLGMESGATNTFWVEVVARQPTGQWAILEGHP